MISIALVMTGCAATGEPVADAELRELATKYVLRGLNYPENPAVRAQAIEAAVEVLPHQDVFPAIRERLRDEHPGVRFAACMVLGRSKDRESSAVLHKLTGDPDASVRVGAYFALERIGVSTYRAAWRDALRSSKDPTVRRNAALALGQLENPAVLPLLQVAVANDSDDGVRLQALEGMAVLGDADAINHFIRDSFGGLGFKQPFALLTLGKVADERVIPVLRRGLNNAPYHEARLAAARGLGVHGNDEGYDLAVGSLEWNDPKPQLPDDPPELQVMRVRQMAALALGTIGQRRALPALLSRMQTPDDSRVQLAAATAILMILDGPAESGITASRPAGRS